MSDRRHEAFISHSTRDTEHAVAVCAALEDAGMACWIAPRDIAPGTSYATSLVAAIAASRIVVLVFSRAANDSEAVLNELEIAFNRGVPVFAVRIDDAPPEGDAEFYLRRRQWFDAHRDFEARLAELPESVRSALRAPSAPAAESRAPRGSSSVPRPSTTFVGRDDDLRAILELLDEGRIVSIVGSGGVGKTRLALEAAARAAVDGREVWFVDLAPLADSALVASTALAAVGAPQPASGSASDALAAQLATLHGTLIFDNCEHVLDEIAALAATLVARCPDVGILATSREALNVPGERVYRLPSLDEDSALAMFAERARAANQHFDLTTANAGTVREICRRLDGIALAIELAAARVRMISVDEIARRLDDRFRILTGGNRSALPRHQTMRALIDWSYELLSEDERTVLRRASVFAGSFSLDAAGSVCGDDRLDAWAVLDLLGSLVDKSLLIADVDDTTQRYRLLQTVAEYARERNDAAGERAALAATHARYCAGFAARAYEEWDTDPKPDWLARMRPELENLRAALTWTLSGRNDVELGARLCGDAVPIFLRLSLVGEAIAWCESALASAPNLAAAVEARLQYGLSMLFNNHAAYERATVAAERAAALYAATDDARATTRALSQVAQLAARWDERRELARATAERAIASARALGDRRLLAATLQRCATVYTPAQIETARTLFSESVGIFRTLGRDEETSRALFWWSEREADANHIERALNLALEAMELDSGDTRAYLATLIAGHYTVLKQPAAAAAAARDALQLSAEMRHPVLVPIALSYLAVANVSEHPDGAARVLGYARARLEQQQWRVAADTAVYDEATAVLRELLGTRLECRLSEGSGWDVERALAEATAL